MPLIPHKNDFFNRKQTNQLVRMVDFKVPGICIIAIGTSSFLGFILLSTFVFIIKS